MLWYMKLIKLKKTRTCIAFALHCEEQQQQQQQQEEM